jgi:siroheme synthase-like protein
LPRYYPIFLDVQGRTCIVFGGNSEAERKVNYLLECGASVTLFSPAAHTTEVLKSLAEDGKVTWKKRTYKPGDLTGAWLAIVADTSDEARNEQVYTEAREKNVALNVMDVTPLCTFIAPAIVQRHDVTVAMSTAGTSPALARRLREELSSPNCQCLRWADIGPVLAGARKEVRGAQIVVCPEKWQEHMTTSWLKQAEHNPQRAQADLVAALAKEHCVACAPHGRCQKHHA